MLLDNGIKKIIYGGTEIGAVYRGDRLVWKAGPGDVFAGKANKSFQVKITDTAGNQRTFYAGVGGDGRFSVKLPAFKEFSVVNAGGTVKVHEVTEFPDVSNMTSFKDLFNAAEWSEMQYMNAAGWNVSNATDFSYMFADCSSLKNLDLSGWNIAAATTLENMFSYCYELESLDLSGWDFRGLSNRYTFRSCTSLANIKGPVTGIRADIDLGYSPLTHETAMVILNSLGPAKYAGTSYAAQLVFKQSTYNLLTPQELALATDKGWRVTTKA